MGSNYLFVALGGAIGSMLRYGITVLVGATDFPMAVLGINIAGCFAMGLLAGYGAFVGQMSEPMRVFLMVGILGGFTTFSAFSLDVLKLVERSEVLAAISYVGLSVLLSLFAVFAGLALVKAIS